LEAYVLSRDTAAALSLFVSPIVRRVSRESLTVSLHQTKVAIDAQKVEPDAIAVRATRSGNASGTDSESEIRQLISSVRIV
jgi:hypothetical protein